MQVYFGKRSNDCHAPYGIKFKNTFIGVVIHKQNSFCKNHAN